MTRDELQEVYEEVAERLGAEFHDDYSGRAMFGKTCFAVSGDDLTGVEVGMAWVTMAKDADMSEADIAKYAPVNTDSLGKGSVFYTMRMPSPPQTYSAGVEIRLGITFTAEPHRASLTASDIVLALRDMLMETEYVTRTDGRVVDAPNKLGEAK